MSFVEFFFLLSGEEDGNREAGEPEVDSQAEKTRHASVGLAEWNGPSKQGIHMGTIPKSLRVINIINSLQYISH